MYECWNKLIDRLLEWSFQRTANKLSRRNK